MNTQDITTSVLIGYTYHGSDELHFAIRDDSEVGDFLMGYRSAVGTRPYPANWREFGASEKDLWEDRSRASLTRIHERNLARRAARA